LSTTASPSLAARFRTTALTPRWIAALVLSLAIAAGFAALGQWQLGRSVDNAQTVEIDTETAVPLDEIAEPGSGMTETQLGRIVTVTGELVAGDTVVLSSRGDGRGATGSWVVGHLVTADGVSLAVALGWSAEDTPTATDPDRVDWTGRYQLSEEPQSSDFESGAHTALSVADLVNLWADPGPVYAGYLVLADPVAPLEPIVADAPEREVALNLLNVFYAIEWVLFAGFAIYLWYRLVRDAVERQEEEQTAP
jgi:cytochrome oxidase assembly protein ShyY1